jgi:hypothetical protein
MKVLALVDAHITGAGILAGHSVIGASGQNLLDAQSILGLNVSYAYFEIIKVGDIVGCSIDMQDFSRIDEV